jgi:hypothetical protein
MAFAEGPPGAGGLENACSTQPMFDQSGQLSAFQVMHRVFASVEPFRKTAAAFEEKSPASVLGHV